jgi:hypothetical protein
MTNEDVLSGPGLDPEILAELTDEEAKELAEETRKEMKRAAELDAPIYREINRWLDPRSLSADDNFLYRCHHHKTWI